MSLCVVLVESVVGVEKNARAGDFACRCRGRARPIMRRRERGRRWSIGYAVGRTGMQIDQSADDLRMNVHCTVCIVIIILSKVSIESSRRDNTENA
jgi:hypothetical protein